MEGPPVRGHAGPGLPLLPAAAPPRQGRGLLPVRRWCKGVEGAGYMYGLFPALGRSGCAGAQYEAAEARSTQLRWGAAWVCDAAPHAAAQGAQRGVALVRSLRLWWGAPWSRAGGWLTGSPQV